jgi:hypothetical protein
MQDEVPFTILEQLRSDPAVTLQQEAIDNLAVSGLNISAHLFQKRSLQAYSAHASTQHNNE